jgi:hypothetical protein
LSSSIKLDVTAAVIVVAIVAVVEDVVVDVNVVTSQLCLWSVE